MASEKHAANGPGHGNSQAYMLEAMPPIASTSVATEHILSSFDSKQVLNTPSLAPSAKDADSPHSEDPSSSQPRSTFRLTFILTALFLSLFIAALDATIVATAVPVITHELRSATGYTWIGGAYLIAHAVAAPIWGKLSDIWGRKSITLMAVTVFFVSSTVCATAKTMQTLIVGRALQGTAGGGILLLVHVVISDLFSMRQRSLFMGLTEGIWAFAGGVGPPLGGAFASLVSWRWCFYINLPICGIAFGLLLMFLDVKHEKTSFKVGIKAIDWVGIFCFLAFSLMVLLGLDFGGDIAPWDSPKVLCLILVGLGMFGAFIYSEAKLARYPLMPLSVFRDKSNVAAFGVTIFHGLAFIPGEYWLPAYLQGVKGASPVTSGVVLIPFMVSTALTGVVTGIVIHRTGRFRELIWLGTALLCLGAGVLILLDTETSIGKFIGLSVILGCGSGMLFEPPLIALQSRTLQKDMATVTSTFSFCRSMAVAVSVILGGVVFQNSMDIKSKELARSGVADNIVEAISGKEAAANVGLANTLADPAQRLIVKGAFAFSFQNMWIMYTALAALGVLSGLFVMKAKLSKDHVETVTGIKAERGDAQRNTVESV